ncbi:MAG: hypothetical protein AAGA56_12440 [Myxococcota bacterium]
MSEAQAGPIRYRGVEKPHGIYFVKSRVTSWANVESSPGSFLVWLDSDDYRQDDVWGRVLLRIDPAQFGPFGFLKVLRSVIGSENTGRDLRLRIACDKPIPTAVQSPGAEEETFRSVNLYRAGRCLVPEGPAL